MSQVLIYYSMHNNQSCIELWAILIKDQARWKWDLFIDTQYLIPLAIVHQEEHTSIQPNESCTTDINGIWSFTKCLISVFGWFASLMRYLPSWVVCEKSILYQECFKPVLGGYQVGKPCTYRLILVLVSKIQAAWYDQRQYQHDTNTCLVRTWGNTSFRTGLY
jgi:hypothetical protein